MAVIRSIRKLVGNPKSILAFSTPAPLSNHPFLFHHPSRFLSPLSKWIPLQAPLFLSSPPWKLSQSTTPLYLHSDLLFISPNLNFLPTPTLPKLGLASVPILTSAKELGHNDLDVEVGRPNLVDSFVNWPNFISFSRLLSGPLLGWMILQEMYIPAFVGLAISGATDWLDGYVARKMGINSVVGSYLDPLADKVLIGCVALAMVEKSLLQSELVVLIVLRDVALVGGAVYKRASSLNWGWRSWFDFFNLDGPRPQKIEPIFLSKVNTVFQLILVTAVLLQPEFGTPETGSYITYLSWLVASTTVASTAAYGVQHLGSRSLNITNKL